ncbi:MAG: cobalamin-dependent protein [Pseudomonadales bacterium]|jgi:methanogenic corrinoid protein MtbC1|nr:cobalamin-dependent protein [Pseudomonadales bacterium]
MEESTALAAREAPAAAPTDRCSAPEERAPVIRTLTELVLERRMRAARALLEQRLQEGIPVEGVLNGYLAPAARRLGSLWDADRVTFTDVTVSVGRLQDLQRELDPLLMPSCWPLNAPRALLATVPGDQHAFGVSMAAALLHKRGWQVSGVPSNREADLISAARTGWFEVIGLSLTCDHHLETIHPLVARLRDASLNREVRITLGGLIAISRPEEVRGQCAAGDEVTIVDSVEALAALEETPPGAN